MSSVGNYLCLSTRDHTQLMLLSYAMLSTGQQVITTASARFGDVVPSGGLSMISFMRVPLLMVGWLSSFCSVRSRGRSLGHSSWEYILGTLASTAGEAATTPEP